MISLKKNEPPPTLRASVRLLRYVFIAAIDFPEFQRQFSTPNISKFGLALVSLADKQDDVEMRVRLLIGAAHAAKITFEFRF
jgi:hypothetical protein